MTGGRTPQGLETLRAQVRLLSYVIAASMVLMFLVVALPWLARMIELDLAPLAWTLTAFAAVHAAFTFASERINGRAGMLRLLYAVPLCGVAFMAVLWHHGGGVSHPSLALMMALPVVAAAALPRSGFAIDIALYSILVVTITAVITSPDLAWYVAQLGIPGAALARLGGEELLRREPFPGATTTPAAMFLFVSTFAAIQLALAFVATRVAKLLRAREEVALQVEQPHQESLPAIALRTTPAATLVTIAGTGQVVQATRRFAQQMLLHNQPVVGRELFALLDFTDTDAVRSVLTSGGAIPFCRYRIGAEERLANFEVETFEHEGITYASVVIDDWNDVAYLAAAAESLPSPLLVIGSDARLRYSNRAAGELFDELYAGSDVTPLLGDRWWAQRRVATHRLTIRERVFEAVATPVELFASGRASVVMLTPRDEEPR